MANVVRQPQIVIATTEFLRLSPRMLAVSNLSLALGQKAVLQGISFAIAPGQSLSLMGPSGSGKTTLLRALAGFHPPGLQGCIRMAGALVFQPKTTNIQPHMRPCIMLFQEIALWPHLNVTNHLKLCLQLAKNKNKNTSCCVEILERVGLTHRALALPKDLSGGEKQRLALARTLMTDPKLLLLDEPFSSLDLATKASLCRLVLDLQAELGFALLHVTHDPFEAKQLSRHFGLLEQGRLAWKGSAQEFESSTSPEICTLRQNMKAWHC